MIIRTLVVRAATAFLVMLGLLAAPGPAVAAAQKCPTFGERDTTGNLTNSSIIEASGLVASRTHDNVYWTHNDSGGTNRIYAINQKGKNLGSFRFGNVSVSDLEDIAIGPGPGKRDHIYVADIGDNGRKRPYVRIYRFPEPKIRDSHGDVQLPDSAVDVFYYRYENPSGGTWSRDAEGLAVDPQTGDVVVMEKELGTYQGIDRASWVYRIKKKELVDGRTTTAKAMVAVRARFERTTVGPVTALDISSNGRLIMAKNGYEVFSWIRATGDSVFQTLAARPVTGCVWEGVGSEALAIKRGMGAFLSVPEGRHAPVSRIDLKVPGGGGGGGGNGSGKGECNYLDATIVGTSGNDVIVGTSGRDIIDAKGGNDVITGLGGRDVICGGKGDDVIRGNSGSDMLRGGPGRDKIIGGGGYDNLVGGRHDDVLKGRNDNDRLWGNRGDDTLRGGAGTDWLYGGSGNDDCSGGEKSGC
ncbi:MAG TPA: calcium-binding protein [Acidimicrobiia bacterium]|jgi:hypothetical protein